MAKKKLSIEKIEAHFTTENDHYNSFTFNLYSEIKLNNSLIEIESILELFNLATSAFYTNRKKPLQTLETLNTEFGIRKFNQDQQILILEHLIRYFKSTVFTTDNNPEEFVLEQVKELLKLELECIRPQKVEIQSNYS